MKLFKLLSFTVALFLTTILLIVAFILLYSKTGWISFQTKTRLHKRTERCLKSQEANSQ